MESRRALAAGTMLALSLAACSSDTVTNRPRLQSPQLRGLQRDMQTDTGERRRAYDACRNASRDSRALVGCMEHAGYRLVSPTDDPRAQDCVRRLDTPGDMPLAYCFE